MIDDLLRLAEAIRGRFAGLGGSPKSQFSVDKASEVWDSLIRALNAMQENGGLAEEPIRASLAGAVSSAGADLLKGLTGGVDTAAFVAVLHAARHGKKPVREEAPDVRADARQRLITRITNGWRLYGKTLNEAVTKRAQAEGKLRPAVKEEAITAGLDQVLLRLDRFAPIRFGNRYLAGYSPNYRPATLLRPALELPPEELWTWLKQQAIASARLFLVDGYQHSENRELALPDDAAPWKAFSRRGRADADRDAWYTEAPASLSWYDAIVDLELTEDFANLRELAYQKLSPQQVEIFEEVSRAPSIAEAARRLKMPPNQAYQQISRAMEKIRALLENTR
jgi:hypothetical protein